MEKTKFNDEIEKLFAECINWAITGPESWHFRATNLMSEMNHEVRRLAAENEKLTNEHRQMDTLYNEAQTEAVDLKIDIQTLSAELEECRSENLKILEALEGALAYIEELKSNNWNNLTEAQKDEAIRKA